MVLRPGQAGPLEQRKFVFLGYLPPMHQTPKFIFTGFSNHSTFASFAFLVLYFYFLFDSLILLWFVLLQLASHKESTFDLNFAVLIVNSF